MASQAAAEAGVDAAARAAVAAMRVYKCYPRGGPVDTVPFHTDYVNRYYGRALEVLS